MIKAYNILVGKLEGRHRFKWEDNIGIDLREIWTGGII
jgi:hypothetical protein